MGRGITLPLKSNGSGAFDAPLSSHHDFDEWKEDELLPLLDGIKSGGKIATSAHYTTYANPGLQIDGEKLIPLPLTARDAEAIKSVCRRAPFGKGDETVVDMSVRKTWELDHSQIKLANPAWSQFFKELVKGAADKLGLGGVSAKPHKLLLYEEGSFFKRHKDSEKEKGMVGTLVVCLPSKHDGGDVHVSFGAQHQTFSTASASGFDITALAWYSDVTHEVKELVSGYRLVLTYKLFQTPEAPGTGGSAASLLHQTQQLQVLFADWKANFDNQHMLVYSLDHQYTETSISLQNMKGRDKAVCRTLNDACSRQGIYLFFAQMTHRMQDDECYYEEPDGEADETVLDVIFTPDGTCLGYNLHIEEEAIIQSGLFDGDADSEIEGEYTGNESMPSSFRYHHTVALLVPRESMVHHLQRFRVDFKTLLPMVIRELESTQSDSSTQKFALSLMGKAIQVTNNQDLGQVASLVVPKALAFGDRRLYQDVVNRVMKYPEAWPAVSKRIASHLDTYFADDDALDWDDWLGSVNEATGLTMLVWWEVVQALASQLRSPALQNLFKVWIEEKLVQKLESVGNLDTRDNGCLIKLLESHKDDRDWVLSRLVPAITRSASRELLPLFLKTLSAKHSEGGYGIARPIFQHVLGLSQSTLLPKKEELERSMTQWQPWPMLDGNDFVDVLCGAWSVGALEEATELLAAFHSRLTTRKQEWLGIGIGVIGSFLQPLASGMVKHNVAATRLTKEIFEFFLKALADVFAKRPHKRQGWVYEPRRCNNPTPCRDCDELNIFLGENEEMWRFPAAKPRRNHIEGLLPAELFSCTIDKRKSPHTLVVEKTGREYFSLARAYNRRIANLKQALAPLKGHFLEELLGGEYDRLVLLNEHTEILSESVTGMKRQAEEPLEWNRRR
ncbi:hypothetical protein GQ53DRAFT_838018 [Thozetella sp. PMI_491]|nr:hypothetical protein GQ53DRAFT_838018 [Thozetella sp. PMI_491]